MARFSMTGSYSRHFLSWCRCHYGDVMPKYNVYAYTPHAHARVATIEVRARDGQSAREKACTELQRQGREPAFLTLVPVQVGATVNPFRV